MKRTNSCTALVLLLLTILWGGAYGQQEGEKALDKYARRAKGQGKASIEMPPSIVDYAVAVGLQKALETQSVLLVRLEEQVSVPSADRDDIWTWYKFAVVKDLSPRALPQETTPPASVASNIPTVLLPLKPNEVLIRGVGGTVEVGGVKVNSPREHGGFSRGVTYLLFGNFWAWTNTGGLSRFGEIELGPAGIFKVNPAGQIAPLSADYRNSPLARDLREQYGNSISDFEHSVQHN